MGRKCITLDLAQCEVFNHLPPNKAGVLIKAVMSYVTTGVVASWGEDMDLKPIFMTFRATLNEQIEEWERERKRKHSEYLRRKRNSPDSPDSPGERGDKETERESERDRERVTPKEGEKAKGKEKETTIEKIQEKRHEEREETEQAENAEREEAQEAETQVRPAGDAKGGTRFKKPSLAEVTEYVKQKGYEQWVDPEAFWCYHENRGWVVGHKQMKSWHLAIVTWMKQSKQRQPLNRGNGTSVGERAYNMLHFEYEGHPEMWEEEKRKIKELQKDI